MLKSDNTWTVFSQSFTANFVSYAFPVAAYYVIVKPVMHTMIEEDSYAQEIMDQIVKKVLFTRLLLRALGQNTLHNSNVCYTVAQVVPPSPYYEKGPSDDGQGALRADIESIFYFLTNLGSAYVVSCVPGLYYPGKMLEILAYGQCIVEYKLSSVGMNTPHRYEILPEINAYAMGFASSLFLTTYLIAGRGNDLIYNAVFSFLFQQSIGLSLLQNHPLPRRKNGIDVFYYNRMVMDDVMKRLFNGLMTRLNKDSEECSLLSISSPPQKEKLSSLPIKSNLGYLRVEGENHQLFYINKEKKECTEIKIDGETLLLFDENMKPTKKARIVSKEELNDITLLTGHTFSFRRKIKKNMSIFLDFPPTHLLMTLLLPPEWFSFRAFLQTPAATSFVILHRDDIEKTVLPQLESIRSGLGHFVLKNVGWLPSFILAEHYKTLLTLVAEYGVERIIGELNLLLTLAKETRYGERLGERFIEKREVKKEVEKKQEKIEKEKGNLCVLENYAQQKIEEQEEKEDKEWSDVEVSPASSQTKEKSGSQLFFGQKKLAAKDQLKHSASLPTLSKRF
jgi:hypothetical protein